HRGHRLPGRRRQGQHRPPERAAARVPAASRRDALRTGALGRSGEGLSAPRVVFNVTDESGEAARLRLACRVTEKAYLGKHRVVVFFDEPALLARFDELLWTFGDGSFVPHDSVSREGAECVAPVALTTGPLPADPAPDDSRQLSVQLAPAVHAFHY